MPRIRGVYGKEPLTCIVSIPLRIAPSMLFPHHVISSARRIAPHGAQEWLSPDMLLQPPAFFFVPGPWGGTASPIDLRLLQRVASGPRCRVTNLASHSATTGARGLNGSASDPRLTWPANTAPSLLLLPSRDGTMGVVAAAITEGSYCVILDVNSDPVVPSTPTSPAEQQLARARNDWRPC